MSDAVLVLNAGSSSIKFALFESPGGDGSHLSYRGLLDDGQNDPRLIVKDADGQVLLEKRRAQFDDAKGGLFGDVVDWVESQGKTLAAIGHRVVNGGRRFTSPVRISQEVIEALDQLTLAPLHRPRCLAPIREISSLRPQLP